MFYLILVAFAFAALILGLGSLSDDRNRHVCDPRPRRRSF